MYHDTEQYRLAFIPKKRNPYMPPEIVFICSRAQFSTIDGRLAILRERLHAAATMYFNGTAADFVLPHPDLFGRIAFGYSGCGYVTKDDCEATFHLPLRGGAALHHTAFTIQLLKIAFLATDTEDAPLSNREQQLDLDLCTDNFRSSGYGHAMGGYVSTSITRWLANYLAAPTTQKYKNGTAPMHDEVVSAMRATWRAVAKGKRQQYGDDCKGYVFDRGAFILDCFGDACDVGVYPSEFRTDEPSHTLSCHNLDTAEQQLTLLAGLAKLCELARGETVT